MILKKKKKRANEWTIKKCGQGDTATLGGYAFFYYQNFA